MKVILRETLSELTDSDDVAKRVAIAEIKCNETGACVIVTFVLCGAVQGGSGKGPHVQLSQSGIIEAAFEEPKCHEHHHCGDRGATLDYGNGKDYQRSPLGSR
eukprot:3015556-Amphidinium_carterae.1